MSSWSRLGFLDPAWVVPLLVALLWLGICALLARVGGWSTLAGPYRAKYPVVGERFRFISGSMGQARLPVNYKRCLFMVVNRHGLRISVLFPFRFRSPPLFIPWSRSARSPFFAPSASPSSCASNGRSFVFSGAPLT